MTVAFSGVSLQEGLRRVLGGGRSFLLTYRARHTGATLSRVRVWGGASAEGRTTPAGTGLAAPAPSWNVLADIIATAADPDARLDAVHHLVAQAADPEHVAPLLARVVRNDTDPRVRDAAADLLRAVDGGM